MSWMKDRNVLFLKRFVETHKDYLITTLDNEICWQESKLMIILLVFRSKVSFTIVRVARSLILFVTNRREALPTNHWYLLPSAKRFYC